MARVPYWTNPLGPLEIVWADWTDARNRRIFEDLLERCSELILAGGCRLVIIHLNSRDPVEANPEPINVEVDGGVKGLVRITLSHTWSESSQELQEAYLVEGVIAAYVDALAAPLGSLLGHSLVSHRAVLDRDDNWWWKYRRRMVRYIVREREQSGGA